MTRIANSDVTNLPRTPAPQPTGPQAPRAASPDSFVTKSASKSWETAATWTTAALSGISGGVWAYSAGKSTACGCDSNANLFLGIAALSFFNAAMFTRQAVRLSVQAGLHQAPRLN